MKKYKTIRVLAVVMMTVLSCFGAITGNAYADSNSMTVSPPYQKIILTPGEEYRNTISVFNSSNSTRDLKYAVNVGSFSQSRNESANDDYGSMNHIDKTSYNQIMDWIELDVTGGELAPGEKKTIGYTIKVPQNAPAGGQYATILVADETTKGQPGTGNIAIDQTFQFASIIYAQVAGEMKEEGEISSNSMPSFLLNGPLTAESMVKNNGNVHTDAEYTFQVWPLFGGEEICTNEEEPETSLILPETERYHAQSCDLPSVGIFKAKQVVKIFGETSIVERTVILCPLWLLFLILFVIIAIVIWVVMKILGSKKRSRNSSDD
ncbi:hypothetical protein IJG22_01970 [Candidatus Saccharibacteria bacterium]|nr:hypothetical protein [Candidatus Saccharibacteria bacterium]